MDPDHPRDPAGVRVEPAEAAVVQDLFARDDEPAVSLFREQLRRGQVHLEGQIERLTQAYLAAVIALPEYQRRRQELEGKIQALATQAQQLDAQSDH